MKKKMIVTNIYFILIFFILIGNTRAQIAHSEDIRLVNEKVIELTKSIYSANVNLEQKKNNDPQKCLTPQAIELEKLLKSDLIQDSTKQILENLRVKSIQSLDKKFTTVEGNFSIHYNDTPGDNDCVRNPTYTDANILNSDGDPIPIYIKTLSESLELSLKTYKDYGFNNPLSLFEVDVYVKKIDALGVAHFAYMNIHNNLSDDILKVTAAHELFHKVQYAYLYLSSILTGKWVTEGTATWAEDLVYDNINDYKWYVNSKDGFLESPEIPLRSSENDTEYSSSLFWKYCAESYGKETRGADFIRTMWVGYSLVADIANFLGDKFIVDAVIKSLSNNNDNFDSGFINFGITNYTQGLSGNNIFDNKKYDYEEGDLYNDVKIINNNDNLSNSSPITFSGKKVESYATNFYSFGVSSISQFVVEFDAYRSGLTNSDDVALTLLYVDEFNDDLKGIKTFKVGESGNKSTEKIQFGKLVTNFDKLIVIVHGLDDGCSYDLKVIGDQSENGIDVALVLDKSGSMNFDNYMEPAKDAAKTFVGLMQTGDQVAVVSFSYGGTVNFPLTEIVSDATKTNAQNAISQIYAGGGTGMGSGIQTAQSELNKGDTSKRQGMVLLSDGYENNYPSVADVLPTIPQTTGIYTIALGENSDQVLLNNIASGTKAIYSFSPTTGDLQNIYNHIRAGISGQQIVQSTNGNINVNQTNSHSVFIDNSISNITFSTVWAGSDLDLTLLDPNGNTIDPNNVNNSNGFFTSGNTYEYYTIPNPIVGEWEMQVLGVDVPHQDYEYSVSASANTNLTLKTSFDQQQYGNGWPILITAEIKENELPTAGATVFANVTTPVNPFPGTITSKETNRLSKNNDNESEANSSSVKLVKKENQYFGTDGILYYDAEMIQLFDDGQHNDRNANDGFYAATYTNTTQPGSYTFKVTAEGNNQSGQKFTRQSTQSTVVDPVQTPSIPILVAPSDGSDISAAQVEFKWQASINADNYTLQVSEDQAFGTLFFEETSIIDVSKTVINLDKNKTYYWRVLATNSSGSSGWSQVWHFNTSAYPKYDVTFKFSVESTCMNKPYNTQEKVVKTNENFIVAPFTMPDFAKNWQMLYDALVGSKFTVEDGAIDENIELDIRVQQISCENPGQYTDPSTFHNPLFLFLGIKVTGENSGETALEDFYYFKNGKKAKICIPHNQAFLDFLNSLNMNVNDLDFAYYLSDQYFNNGITQVQVTGKNGDVDSTCIYLEHFSQIAGGAFSKITDVDDINLVTPTEYGLDQNYPNPFNPTTTISYCIPESGKVSLSVYDVLGKEVAILVDETRNAGSYSVEFNASDLVSGIYFYKLQINNFVETKKLILMK